MKQQNFFEDPKGVLHEIQQQSLRMQQQAAQQAIDNQQPTTSHEITPQVLSTFTVPSAVQELAPTTATTTTSPTTVPSGNDQTTHLHSIMVNRRPKPGILRLDMSKPRRSSGGSVEFRMQPQMFGVNTTTPIGTTPPPHHLSVTWATPPCDSIEREFKIKSTTPSATGAATDVTVEQGALGDELNEITGVRKRSAEEKPYEFTLSYAASNLASPVTEPFIEFPLHRPYEDYHNQSPGYSIHTANTDNTNDNGDDDDDIDDDEDYSVSVSAIMQRRASVRGYRRKSSSRNSRRASSPMDHVLDNAERRRSSVYTTSSDEGTNQESTQEQIFENIRLHKEVIQSVKLQPWPIRKKLKLVRQAKTYVARHEGALQERFAMSRSTRDLWARFKILMAARWRHWKREVYSFLTVLIPWELRIKEIESHFGSGVASYFTFLRWLMWLNLMIALPLVLFVIGPEYFATKHDVMDPRKKMTSRESNVAGNLLTIWEFEGHLKYSPMFYGYYSGANSTEPHASGAYALGYVLPLAYFLTAVVVYIYSFVATLKKMAENSRNSKLSEKDDECTFSWKLFTGWDFMIGHAETAHNRIASVVLNFKEALLEEAEKKKDNRDWRIIMQRVVVNILVIGLLGFSGVSVVHLVNISEELNKSDDWLSKNAVNVCMNLLALIMPMIFEALGFFEHWHPRQQLRLQLARVMILNLLNLYSLMFTSFFKIEGKGAPLHDLKAKNETATKQLEELNQNWQQYLDLITPTTEADITDDDFSTLMDNDTTMAVISSATEAIMAGATDVIKKLYCYNVTVRCSQSMRFTKSYPSTTTMATTTLMLLNLTTTMLPTMMNSEQPKETTWFTTTTTDASTATTTLLPLNTTEFWTNPTITTDPNAFTQTTPGKEITTTTMITTTTTEYPGNDTVFDYHDYFDGLSLSNENNEYEELVNPESNDKDRNTYKPKRKRKSKREQELNDSDSKISPQYLNEVSKTTLPPRRRKGRGKLTKVKQARSYSLDGIAFLEPPKKSRYSHRDEQREKTLPYTTTPATEYTSKSATNQDFLSTRKFPEELKNIQLPSTDSLEISTLTPLTTNPSSVTTLSAALESQGNSVTPNFTTTTPSSTENPTAKRETVTLSTQSAAEFKYTRPNYPILTTQTNSDVSRTTPLPDIIWEPNTRLQDLLDFFTTSTPKPLNGYRPPKTTTPIADENISTTPYFLEGDLDTSQTVWLNNNEIDYNNMEICIKTVCDELPTTTTAETTTLEPTTKSIVTTTMSPLQEYELNRTRIEKIIDEIELQLTTMCWETALGQELCKVIVLDALMAIGTSLIIDFLRALFVRYVNQNWCWDMEKTFPQYGDFKIAENILMLINNQGQVWMGIFFSPGLVLINLVKLVVMMYFRSWIVLTCNVPHEVVFKASKSNNFYLALLLTVLFLCVLPVGYAIVWLRPSWHCGPFSKYKTISDYIISTTMWALPKQFHKPLEYLTSSSTVIPLLLLMMLIIYYLISLTGALREANQDLKTQLQKEREEERKKFFKVPEVKAAETNSLTMSNRWRKVLEASSPVTPTATTVAQPDFESEEYKTQARKELISRIMKKALRKDSATSDEELMARHGRDDDTDTEHHDSLPHDEDGGGGGGGVERKPGLSRLQQIRRTRKPSLVDIVQIANSERERLRSLHHQTQNGNGDTESHPRGRFKVERPERKHEREEREKEKNKETTETNDSGNDPDIKTRVINERRQSLLRKKKEDEEKQKEIEKEKENEANKETTKETDITKTQQNQDQEKVKEKPKEKEKEKDKDKEKSIDKQKDQDLENNKDTAENQKKNAEKDVEKIKNIAKSRDNGKGGNGKPPRELPKDKNEEIKQSPEENKPSSPIRKRIYESFRRKKREDKEKMASVKQNSLEKTEEEEGKSQDISTKKEPENGAKKRSLSLRKKDKHSEVKPDDENAEKSPPKLFSKSSFKMVDEKPGTTSHHDDKYSALTMEHLHNLGEKFKFKRHRHKTPTEPEIFKFDTDKTIKDADIATTPTWQHLESELQSPRITEEVSTPTSAPHLHLGTEKLANFSRQSRRKLGSFLTLVKDAVKRPEHELESEQNPETTIDIPATPSIQMSAAFNNAFMLPLALHAPSNTGTAIGVSSTTITTDSIQPYIMPRAPLEVPEDIDPPSYAHSMAACENITAAPIADTEDLDKAGPIIFAQRRISQRRRTTDRPIRQDSQTSNWSLENIPTITISATPEGDEQSPRSPNVSRGDTEASAPIPIPGPKVNVIKIHIDK